MHVLSASHRGSHLRIVIDIFPDPATIAVMAARYVYHPMFFGQPGRVLSGLGVAAQSTADNGDIFPYPEFRHRGSNENFPQADLASFHPIHGWL